MILIVCVCAPHNIMWPTFCPSIHFRLFNQMAKVCESVRQTKSFNLTVDISPSNRWNRALEQLTNQANKQTNLMHDMTLKHLRVQRYNKKMIWEAWHNDTLASWAMSQTRARHDPNDSDETDRFALLCKMLFYNTAASVAVWRFLFFSFLSLRLFQSPWARRPFHMLSYTISKRTSSMLLNDRKITIKIHLLPACTEQTRERNYFICLRNEKHRYVIW